jgi:hypothetical protein
MQCSTEFTNDFFISLWAGRLRNWDSMPSRGKRVFSLPQHPEELWSSLIQWMAGHLSLGVKQPVLEPDHSTSSL